jgi:hypothetical protein
LAAASESSDDDDDDDGSSDEDDDDDDDANLPKNGFSCSYTPGNRVNIVPIAPKSSSDDDVFCDKSDDDGFCNEPDDDGFCDESDDDVSLKFILYNNVIKK